LLVLPAGTLTRINAADLTPQDVIVYELERKICRADAERIKAILSDAWPGRKILVIDTPGKLRVRDGNVG
jgi:hypothetical protein